MMNLAQFAAFPTHSHMAAAKRVVRYLKGNQNVGLTVGVSNVVGISTGLEMHKVSIYFDSSWADDKDDSRSRDSIWRQPSHIEEPS